jgi:polygalacturonase
MGKPQGLNSPYLRRYTGGMHSTLLRCIPVFALVAVLPSLAWSASPDLGPIPAPPFTTVAGDTADDSGPGVVWASAYGASTDSPDNAPALQNAIQAASAAATGAQPAIVVLRGGTFVSGPLVLTSNVYLKVEAGTTLKALPMGSYPGANSQQANFVTASGATNLGVFGGGTIDGNGGNGSSDYAVFSKDTTSWWGHYLVDVKPRNAKDLRPRTLYFTRCSNLLVKDVTIQNSPSMSLMTSGGTNIVVVGVTIQAPAKATPGDRGNGSTGDAPNTDGFDPGGNSNAATSNLWVDRCTFDVGDDCIAVKAASTDGLGTVAVRGLYVTNSTFYHGHGLSFGGQTTYGVADVRVDRCTFVGTQYGVKIKSPRKTGGDVHGVAYTNLTMTNVGRPLWFTAYYPDGSGPTVASVGQAYASDRDKAYSAIGTPYYHDVVVDTVAIHATVAGGVVTVGEVVGTPEKPFTGFVVRGVTVDTSGTAGAPTGLWVRNATVTAGANVWPAPVVDTVGGTVQAAP